MLFFNGGAGALKKLHLDSSESSMLAFPLRTNWRLENFIVTLKVVFQVIIALDLSKPLVFLVFHRESGLS